MYKAIVKLISGIVKLLPFIGVYLAAKNAEKLKAAKKALSKKKDQEDAALNVPRNKRNLIKFLRNSKS